MSNDEKIPRAIADIIADARRERVRPPTLAEREAGFPLPHSQREREEPALDAKLRPEDQLCYEDFFFVGDL